MTSNNKIQQFDLIYQEHADSITRLCYMYLKDSEMAQDAAQETFIKVYRKLSTFRNHSSINTWITSIAINTCKSMMRKKSFGATITLDEAIEFRDDAVLDMDQNMSIGEAIKSLPSELREVVLLKYYRGLKTKEIAKILKVPTTTINYRLSKSKEILKEKLKEDFDYD